MSIREIIRLETKLLIAFYVLAQELHFGRAAARLHLSPPPLSKQIRQLEQIVGTPLFIRSTRAVKLTAAGAVMLEELQDIFTRLDGMLRRVGDASLTDKGTLVIGLTPTAAGTPFIEGLHEYRLMHPDVELDLHEMNSIDMENALRAFKIDVALMRPIPVSSDISITIAHKEPMCIVTRKDDLLSGSSVKPSQILSHPIINYEKQTSPYFRRLVERILSDSNRKAMFVQESLLPTIMTLVEAGVGIAIVPLAMVNLRQDSVKYIPIDCSTPIEAEMAIAWLKSNSNPLVQNFIGSLLSYSQTRKSKRASKNLKIGLQNTVR